MQYQNVDHTIDNMVMAGISSIRAEVEQRNYNVNLAEIPVPPDSQSEKVQHPRKLAEKPVGQNANIAVESTTVDQFKREDRDTTHAITPLHSNTSTSINRDTPQNVVSTFAKPAEQQSHQTSTITAGPVLYERAGSQISAPYKPRYERVNLHEVPLTLPAPPSAKCVPLYPSQEEVHKVQNNKDITMNEKRWMGQYKFDGKSTSSDTKLASSTIPFPSPYVQNSSDTNKLFPTDNFDPQKPPPKPCE